MEELAIGLCECRSFTNSANFFLKYDRNAKSYFSGEDASLCSTIKGNRSAKRQIAGKKGRAEKIRPAILQLRALSKLSNRKGLFAYYFKFNFGYIAAAKIDRSLVRTQFFYFIYNRDTFAVNFITFLVTYCTGNL